MPDGPVAETPQGTPSRRALGAMEIAVRRARERAGPTTVTTPTAEVPAVSRPPTDPFVAQPTPSPVSGDQTAQREHWLRMSVAVVAVLVVAAAIALIVSLTGGSSQVAAPPSSTIPTTAHSGTHPAAHAGSHAGTQGSSRSSRTTSTTAPPATPGGPPVISSISPASGTAGQGIQVAGSNFLSSDGHIVATFNGQVAATSCPTSNTCTVTVPAMTGASSAQVVITTASGTSNAVTFTYS